MLKTVIVPLIFVVMLVIPFVVAFMDMAKWCEYVCFVVGLTLFSFGGWRFREQSWNKNIPNECPGIYCMAIGSAIYWSQVVWRFVDPL